MSNVDTVQTTKPPLIILNALIFALTALVTLIAVPWYGFEHGYSAGIWAFAVFFLVANEMSITAGYHRLWAHKSYEAHWLLRVFYLAANNSIKTCPESRNYYDRKRSEGKRHSQTILCLARRRLNVLWAMQRDNTSYQPGLPRAA